jgi:hypothetical protein
MDTEMTKAQMIVALKALVEKFQGQHDVARETLYNNRMASQNLELTMNTRMADFLSAKQDVEGILKQATCTCKGHT